MPGTQMPEWQARYRDLLRQPALRPIGHRVVFSNRRNLPRYHPPIGSSRIPGIQQSEVVPLARVIAESIEQSAARARPALAGVVFPLREAPHPHGYEFLLPRPQLELP